MLVLKKILVAWTPSYSYMMFGISSKAAIAALRAGAEIAGVPVRNCILLAGGNNGIEAAQRISMPCVAVKSR